MSFNQFGKLFRPYLEFVCHFKERYFVVNPLTDADIDSIYNRVEEMEDGRPVTHLMAIFPLKWKWKHFEKKPEYYVVKPEDLDTQDQLSYEKLATYVMSFSLVRCVDVNNNLLFDNNMEYLLVNRFIKRRLCSNVLQTRKP